jgi:hypothetical protein
MTKYRYVEDLIAPKKWFKANIDSIMNVYGPRHHIQKEDPFLGQFVSLFQGYHFSFRIIVISTLDAPDQHPDGQVSQKS